MSGHRHFRPLCALALLLVVALLALSEPAAAGSRRASRKSSKSNKFRPDAGAVLEASVAAVDTAVCVQDANATDGFSNLAKDPNPAARQALVAFNTMTFEYLPRAPISPGVTGAAGLAISEAEYSLLQLQVAQWQETAIFPNFFKAFMATNGKNFTKVEQYMSLYSFFGDLPPLAKLNVTSDDLFAKQLFTAYPNLLRQASAVPFPLSDGDIKNLLPPGSGGNLVSLLANGRLYVADLSFLRPIQPLAGKGRYFGNPVALFAWSESGQKLTPLAIQINSPEGPVYTPNDTPGDWLLAKIFFNSAAIQEQQIDHFITTHLAIEPIKTAAYRRLSSSHPVRAIIEFYMQIMFGNSLAGFRLLFPEKYGGLDRALAFGAKGTQVLLAQKFSTWSWQQDILQNQINGRGLGKVLPAFDFFQDALAISGAVNTFVSDFLKVYYASDAEVAADGELAAWASETANPGFGGVSGFPTSFTGLADLTATLTHLIHLTTTKHHSMNTYSLFDLGGTLPFQTPILSQPPPTAKGLPLESVIQWMPSITDAINIIALERTFSRPMQPSDSFYDGVKLSPLYTPRTTCAVENFLAALDTIGASIEARADADTVLPYRVLSPKRMPHYVFI